MNKNFRHGGLSSIIPLIKFAPAGILLAITHLSCSKNNREINDPQKGNHHFIGHVLDYTSDSAVHGATVMIERVIGSRISGTFYYFGQFKNNTVQSNFDGYYSFTFLNDPQPNYYSMNVKKSGYVFIGYPTNRDSIYASQDTIINNLYIDRISQMRIHIRDVDPALPVNNYIDIYREFKDPVTGAAHFGGLTTFEGSVDKVLIDTFSYKWASNITISWQVRTNSGIPASGVIRPVNINVFGINDVQINY